MVVLQFDECVREMFRVRKIVRAAIIHAGDSFKDVHGGSRQFLRLGIPSVRKYIACKHPQSK